MSHASHHRNLRPGAIGALLDEYERSAAELRELIVRVPPDEWTRVADPHTTDENCRSIQTVVHHVIRAGLGYANYLRERFGMRTGPRESDLPSPDEALARFDRMLSYTAETLEGRFNLSEPEIKRTTVVTHWGVKYDMEQLLEHAIVHVLRHRRQIEKFLRARESVTT